MDRDVEGIDAGVAYQGWRSVGTPYQLLVQAIEALSGARNLDQVVEIVRGSARAISGAAGICVVLRDGDLCHYVAEDADAPLWAGQTFPMATCVSGWAMLNRETVVIPDIRVDARIPQDAYAATFVRSLVMTPVGEEPFAAIGAYWPYVRHASDDEIHLLAMLARATATAFRNVQLFDSLHREARRNEALNRDLVERIREREEAAERQALIVRELNHRARNMLSIVQSIASQTFRNAAHGDNAVPVFEARLVALARAHGMITNETAAPPTLRDLIRRTMEPFDPEADRVRIEGPDFAVPKRSAVTIALAVHELGTNAAKYGALSNDEGRITVWWAIETVGAEPRLCLTWREEGGPEVQVTGRRGFGSQLIEQALAADMGGTARLAFPPQGLICTVDVPAASLQFEALGV